eukprot:m.109983 g.109983  ORF g.109983 m.109983 type:complete len:56 (-) comp12741_c1_seq16:236-403(-)
MCIVLFECLLTILISWGTLAGRKLFGKRLSAPDMRMEEHIHTQSHTVGSVTVPQT